MPPDETLAGRIRALLAGEEVTEQRMFGGLGFLVSGNLAVSASGQGGLLVRADPSEADELVRTGAAEPMRMRGRSLRGWLRVRPADDEELAAWVERGLAYARSLPPRR